MKKNLKTIIGIVIGIIIGISTTVGAATAINSKDVSYSSSATSKTNVKDSLDELYSKVGECPEGKICLDGDLALKINIGDYISMTPTSTSYTPPSNLTGYTLGTQNTLNPSELNLWRVIRKNEDGTIDVVSEYVSSENIIFYGQAGYMNLVGALNTIAAQYTNEKYVSKTRHMGYTNQKEKCTTFSISACPNDTGYTTDTNLVQVATGTLVGKHPSGYAIYYWLASRYLTGIYLGGYLVSAEGEVEAGSADLTYTYGGADNQSYGIRPILTLKADIQIKSGDGKSASTAYQLD